MVAPAVVVEPPSAWEALNVAEIWHFRDLLWSLAGRDIRLRYKQTLLGACWVVLQPLLAAGIFTFVFGKVGNFSSNGVPYFIFSYTGLLAWNLFSATLSKSSASLVGNAQLISKVYFPRAILPLSAVPSALIDFAVAAAVLAVLMPLWGIRPGLAMVLAPVWVLIVLLLAAGAGLIASALSVSYRDVQYVLPVLTQFLLYASPIAYPVSQVPQKYRAVFMLNPLCSLLEGFRWSVLGGRAGDLALWPLCYSVGLSAAIFLLGMYLFKRMEQNFADVI